MNIFVLHNNPKIAAQMHNDKHVVKMILETAQLLCTSIIVNGGEAPYKCTHVNHPSAIWARESKANYLWLVKLGLFLCKEYTFRYNKVHKSKAVIEYCLKNMPNFEKKEMTDFALAMPDQYKLGSAVESYRAYYLGEKMPISNWTKRDKPDWL
jgi:hypothetical protein